MLPVCSSCGQYVRSADVSCPFCDARLAHAAPGMRLPSASSVALGLSLVALNACFVGVAKYGVAPMDDTVDMGGGDADEDGYVSEDQGGDEAEEAARVDHALCDVRVVLRERDLTRGALAHGLEQRVLVGDALA